MAQPTSLHFASSLTYFYLTIVFCLLYARAISIAKKNGFTLELIRNDDDKNLTDTEKVMKLFELAEISDRVLEHQMSTTTSSNISSLKTINLPLSQHYQHIYLVKLHLGNPGVPLFLGLDTATDLSWTQCEPCTRKFHQNPPIFDPRRSRTFRSLPCNDPFVTPDKFRCINNQANYVQRYGIVGNKSSRPTTEGFLAQDELEHQYLVIFGCSRDSQNFHHYDQTGQFGGLLGLAMSPHSILHQLGQMTHGRFSYCLPSYNAPASTVGHLKFGDAIPMHGRHFQATQMFDVPGFMYYHVNLLDISVGTHRLEFPSGTFSLSGDRRTGGCIFDSGAGMSPIIQHAYNPLVTFLIDHFWRIGHIRKYDYSRVCFEYKSGSISPSEQLRTFPSLTFHFDGGANMVVEPRDLYMDINDGQAFCMAFGMSRTRTIIGAIAQANKRIVYDTALRQILFAPEDCLNDRA